MAPVPTLVNTWTASDMGGYGPVDLAVANKTGNGLIAFIASGSNNVSGNLERHSISDDIHNWWIYAGSSTTVYPAANRRVDVWVCPNAKAATVISVGTSIVYAGLVAEVCEFSGFPQYATLDFTAVNGGYGTSVSVSGTAAAADYVFGAILFSAGPAGTVTGPVALNPLTNIGTGSGSFDMSYQSMTPVWGSVAAGAVSESWSWTTAASSQAIIVGLKQLPTAPTQPNPNWPSMKVEAAFGYQPGNTNGTMPTWTDITSRAMNDEGETILDSARGRGYELAQPEAGELNLNLQNNDGGLNPANTSGPYYPNVLPEVPVRASAFWQGRQMGVGFGYAHAWPQNFPDRAWGETNFTAGDAIGIASQGSMPSALAGQYLCDFPYAYYPFGEDYQTPHGGLFANLSRYNQKPMIGYSPPYLNSNTILACGQTLGLAGDLATAIGANNITYPGTAEGGGAFVRDNSIPGYTNGFTIEFWCNVNAVSSTTGLNEMLVALTGTPVNYQSSTLIGTYTNQGSQRIWCGFTTNGTGFLPTIRVLSGSGIVAGASSATTITANTLFHFAAEVSYNGSGGWTVTLYINGVNVGTGSGSFTGTLLADTLIVGPPALKGMTWNVTSNLAPWSNYIIGQLGVYPWSLPGPRVAAHYKTGISADSGDPVITRVGKLMAWSQMGLPFGGGLSSPSPLVGNADQIQGQALADNLYALSVDEGGMYYAPATSQGEIWYSPRTSLYNQTPKYTFGENFNTTPGSVGAFFDAPAMGGTDFNSAQTLWNGWTGATNKVTRCYLGNNYTYTTQLQEMVAAGVKICLDYHPAVPNSSGDLASLNSILSTLKAAGANCEVSLWAEPYYAGLSSTQFITMMQYYGPTVRQYFPLVFNTSSSSVQLNNENSYYPGDAWIDKIATDHYCSAYLAGATLSACANVSPGKPFGIWEMNGSTDPVVGQTQAQITAFFASIQNFMTSRAASGLPNADVIFFNEGYGLGGNPWFLNNSTADWSAFNGTIAGSTAQVFAAGDYAWSGLFTVSGTSGGAAENTGAAFGVTVGQAYTGSAWVYSSAASLAIGFDWLTTGGTYLSTTVTNVTVTPNTWTLITTGVPTAITAPATSLTAYLRVGFQSGAANGSTLYFVQALANTPTGGGPNNIAIVNGADYRLGLWRSMLNVLSSTVSGEVPFLSGDFDFSDTYLANIVSSQRTISEQADTFTNSAGKALYSQNYNNYGVDAITADPTSEAEYFPRGPLQQDIETTSDEDAYDRANWTLAKYKQPMLRANQILIDPASNPVLFAVALQVEQGDVVTVNRRPIGAPEISLQCIVQKVEHVVGPDLWQTTLTLAPYFPENAVIQLGASGFDTAGAGVLGW